MTPPSECDPVRFIISNWENSERVDRRDKYTSLTLMNVSRIKGKRVDCHFELHPLLTSVGALRVSQGLLHVYD